MTVVARCEAHACKNSQDDLLQTRALNQYCHKTAKSQDWKKDLIIKGRTIALTEYSRNKAKLARWVASAVLAGASEIKLGWVVRQNVSEKAHDILKTETIPIKTFAKSVNVTPQNMWAVLARIVSEIRKQEEGRYIMMKDPNKQTIRMYRIRQDEFENEEDLDDSGDEGSD